MSEIKSEKAKELIRERILDKRFNDGLDHTCIRVETAVLAVSLAEQEAEELHAKEIAKYNQSLDEAKQREQLSQDIIAKQRKQIQELKDKTVDAFRFAIDLPKESDTYKLLEKLFTQKLTDK